MGHDAAEDKVQLAEKKFISDAKSSDALATVTPLTPLAWSCLVRMDVMILACPI